LKRDPALTPHSDAPMTRIHRAFASVRARNHLCCLHSAGVGIVDEQHVIAGRTRARLPGTVGVLRVAQPVSRALMGRCARRSPSPSHWGNRLGGVPRERNGRCRKPSSSAGRSSTESGGKIRQISRAGAASPYVRDMDIKRIVSVGGYLARRDRDEQATSSSPLSVVGQTTRTPQLGRPTTVALPISAAGRLL